MEKVTYSPGEFAAVFGKERTWAYRQLYSGKVQAVTGLGRTLIPKSEVERLLSEAGRYLGAKAKVKKQVLPAVTTKPPAHAAAPTAGSVWKTSIASRRQRKIVTSKKPLDVSPPAIISKVAVGSATDKKAIRREALLRLGGQKL